MKVNWLYQKTIDCPSHILVHSGGSQSSKTVSVLQALFTIAATEKNKVITVVGQDLPNLKKGAIRDARAYCESVPFFQQQISQYNKSEHTYTFETGSIIEFTSYDDEQDARSGKRTHCFINEANGVSYGIFEQLRIRTTDLIAIDFNPSAEFWAHEKLQGRHDVTWVNSTFRDNKFINKTTKDAILAYEPTPENIARGTANEYRWKVYGLGQVARLEGLVFPNWKQTNKWPEHPKWTVYGMDFGYTNDPTTLIEVCLHAGALHIRQHIYETGLTNQDISQRLEHLNFDRNQKITADSAEPKSIEELKRLKWRIEGAQKGKDSINNGIDALKRYNLYICAKSKDLIQEFSQYTWQKDRNGKSMNKPIDKYNHGIDAVRYAVQKKLNTPSLGYA